MDYLKDGIGLRAMAQRDPLIEYQREGYQMFQAMMGQIKEESVGYLYNLEVEVRRAGEGEAAQVEAKGLGVEQVEGQRLQYSASNDAGEVEVRNDRGQVQQAATTRLRQAAAAAAATPAQAPVQAAPAAEAQRGAFGQRTDAAAQPPQQAPQNRAQRRAAEQRKK
jgi:preprotein translocase subunit SecA